MAKTDTDTRGYLISLTRGHEDAVLFFRVGYMLVAAPVEEVDGKPDAVRDSFIMPCEHRAVHAICDATDAHIAARLTDTQRQRMNAPAGAGMGGRRHFLCVCTDDVLDDTASDADIATAMASQPCLVNYGGKLRAMNTDAAGGCKIILKDIKRT